MHGHDHSGASQFTEREGPIRETLAKSLARIPGSAARGSGVLPVLAPMTVRRRLCGPTVVVVKATEHGERGHVPAGWVV